MEAIKKLAFAWGDKVVLGLFVLWTLFEMAIALSEMGGTPTLLLDAEKIRVAVEQSNPVAPEPRSYDFSKKFDQQNAWDLKDHPQQRKSLYFVDRVVNKSEKQEQYVKKLKDHKHHFIDSLDGSGGKVCVFPGCDGVIQPPDELIALPVNFKVVEAGVMKIELSWDEPTDNIKARLAHFELQKKKGDEKEWQTILAEDGTPLKIGLQFTQSEPVFEGMIPELKGLPNMSNGLNNGLPPEAFFKGEFFPEEFGFEGFGFPPPPNAIPTKPKVKVAPKQTVKTTKVEGDKKGEVVEEEKEKAQFTYLDFNLDPNTKYSYRIKSFGISGVDMKLIESPEWSEVLEAKTKEDKSVRFTKYIPGLRDKNGQLVKKPDGSVVSPDKVYVTVSKLFTPPWTPQRYFIEYEHKGIIPGIDGSDGIGKEVTNYDLKTEDGYEVYINTRESSFLYAYPPKITEEQVKVELENNKVWKRFRVTQDFSLPWRAIGVDEEIKKEEVVKSSIDATGKKVEKIEINETYHYFLNMVNRVTQEKDRVELERDNPNVRILKY